MNPLRAERKSCRSLKCREQRRSEGGLSASFSFPAMSGWKGGKVHFPWDCAMPTFLKPQEQMVSTIIVGEKKRIGGCHRISFARQSVTHTREDSLGSWCKEHPVG